MPVPEKPLIEGDSPKPKPRRRRRWLRRILFSLIFLLLAAVVGHGIWGVYADRKLTELINGYRQAGEPITLEDFSPATVPDEQNAAFFLRKAADSIDSEDEAWKRFEEIEGRANGLPLTAEEMAEYGAVAAAHFTAFDDVSRAANCPQIEWGIQFTTPALIVSLPHLNKQRALARVVNAAALHAHQTGDDAQAIQRVSDLFVISRAVDQSPMLVPHLVAEGIFSIACDTTEKIAPILRVEQNPAALGTVASLQGDGPSAPRPASRAHVVALIHELLNERPPRDGLRRAMLGERMAQIDACMAVADGRLALSGVQTSPTERAKIAAEVSGYVLRRMVLTDARIMAEYTTTVRSALDAPDYPTFQARMGGRSVQEETSPKQLHWMAALLLMDFRRAACVDYQILAERRMAAVSLACRLYALDHTGKLPASLAELVPTYLPAVPIDPLSAGLPLGYVGSGDRPIVYSVGEDGRDDGGYEPPETATRKQRLEKSDDVRHLKRQPRAAASVDSSLPDEPLGPPRFDGL